MSDRYALHLSTAAKRALAERLPSTVSFAIWEFCNGALRDNPHRVGQPLEQELKGYRAARRGPYRVVYLIDEAARTVAVVRIDHRADVYRPR